MYAKQLNGTHIGLVVVFDTTTKNSGVELTVRGTLKEVHHRVDPDVTLWLSGPSDSTGLSSAYILPNDTTVTVFNTEGGIIG